MRQLGDYATTIAEGDFNTAMELDVVDDTGRLADIMQYMSHQLQQMMMRYQDALNKAEKAQEAAENANLSKSAFIADVSHELRTPLNGILGYTQLLLRDNTLTAKHRQGIQVIDKSGSHLLSLINDILDMAKMEAGRIELHTQDFILASFLQDIVELFVIRARNKHIEFNYEVCKNLPATVHADAKRLRQVLMNLLSNAIKFTRHGSVTFSICPDALGRVRFSIEDTGVGIAEEDFNAVFQPFKQVGENAQKHEGTGLGLSISKNLVAKMGGELMFKSVLGQGSTFWFAIYLPEAQNPQLARDEDIQNISGYRVLQDDIDTYKILVVDDKAENRVIVRSILEPLGFDVLEANQGCKALDIALAYHPHLILMDLVMPDVDGFQATTHFKHHPDLVHIPIVAVSASVFDADQQRSLDAGCVEFLAKPLQIPELLNCLQNHLKLKWIHGVQPQITTPAPAMTMDGPTSAQAAKIYDLADKGYISEIIDYIDELKQQCPDIQVFLSKLREHAENFDDEAVRNLVQFYMVDEDSPPNGGV